MGVINAPARVARTTIAQRASHTATLIAVSGSEARAINPSLSRPSILVLNNNGNNDNNNTRGRRGVSTSTSTLTHTSTSPSDPNTTSKPASSESNTSPSPPKRKKTIAELDEELRMKMAGTAGDGGEAGLELEDGKVVGMKRGVRENMFRYI